VSSRFGTVLVVAIVAAVGYAYANAHGSLLKNSTAPHGGPSKAAPAPARTSAPAPGGGSAAGQVFVFATGTTAEPRIYSVIQSARKSLEMTMYELSDTTAVNDLIARHKAGVNVRVVLDQKEKTTNQAAFDALHAAGVGVTWSSPSFAYTHQKTLTVDDRESLVLTGNLTSKYYAETRDFGVEDTDAHDVAAIVATFNADFAGQQTNPADATDLLWSPNTAKSRVLAVINHAAKTLDVESEEFNDPSVVSAVAARAKAGVQVRVMVESPAKYASELRQVTAAGGKAVGYSSSTGLYIHAKAVIADAGLPRQEVEVGSMNYTTNSLTRNRELGIVVTNPDACALMAHQFATDFAGAAPQ
jgi:phosphatidylserine/phosphatidylglycerophosphate/cardiolipin synthase-like enzyme